MANNDEKHCCYICKLNTFHLLFFLAFTCSSSYFPCVHERKCIGTGWLCDGDNDCRDGSDEVYANCHGGAWSKVFFTIFLRSDIY